MSERSLTLQRSMPGRASTARGRGVAEGIGHFRPEDVAKKFENIFEMNPGTKREICVTDGSQKQGVGV
jgi:hypothetical protein